jgi:hypothetical protein
MQRKERHVLKSDTQKWNPIAAAVPLRNFNEVLLPRQTHTIILILRRGKKGSQGPSIFGHNIKVYISL